MTAMFDTLKFARTLRDGGRFTPEPAERLSDALSDAISGEVVNRADLAATEAGLHKQIEESRTELKAEIAGLRTDMKSLEAKIEPAKADTIKWIVGLFGVQVVALLGGVIALARLLPK